MTYWTCHHPMCEGRKLHPNGVPNHRAKHRRNEDGPVVMTNGRYEFTYDYRPEAGAS